MKPNTQDDRRLQFAKAHVRRIRTFYWHLIFYCVAVALIALNFYVLEGPYTSIITGLNITVLVLWTAAISIHAWRIYKGRILFRKSWEDKKTKKFMEEEKVETTIWE